MVLAKTFIKPINHLWKYPNSQSITVFSDPRKYTFRENMAHKYAERFEHFEERNNLQLCSIESSPKSRTTYKRMQATCYNFLERPNGILSISYHFALFGLVVVGLVFAVLETMEELKNNNGLILSTYILEMFLLVVFILEYLLRMWSAGCRSTYSGFLGRLRFAFKPFVIVDIVVIGSTFGVTVFSDKAYSTVSILRFFQILRMVRFDRQGGSWKLLGSVLFLHKQELLTTFYIGFCSLIFASFFVYQAERVENESEFSTFADSFWWGVVTLTTVGYGDKVPKTWAGRGVAAFFAIMGISFFALPAGILGSGFALKVSQHQRQKHVKRRRRPAAMLIQCNWRYFASRKNSKLNATWSPYIKYLQGSSSSSKKDDRSFEKPSQPVGRVRKISIFGRKASGQSSEALHRPSGNTTPEQARLRGHKGRRSDMFHSSDSLHDGHSTADQHSDDEHGTNHVRRKPILVTNTDGNIDLPAAYKQSIRFTRYLKFLVALRKFRLAKKPYDVKDVIEQYSTGHVEVLGKVKSIGNKIDEALGYKVGTEKVNENQGGRTNVVHRLSKLEKQVKSLETKLDHVVTLLVDSKRRRSAPPLCEEQGPCCCMCRHNCDNCHRAEKLSSDELQNKENISNKEKPVRRRKVGMNNLNLDKGCLSEREEPAAEEQSRSSVKSGQNLDNNNYVRNSVKIETDGCNFLSPGYGYDDGDSYLSRQSSTYGISDNCPSPNPSTASSEDSYQSRDNIHHNSQNMLLPSNGMVPVYSDSCQSRDDVGYHDDQIPSDGMPPLYSHHAPEHGTFLEISVHDFTPPQHELYGRQNAYGNSFTPPQFGASSNSHLGMSSAAGHLSPNYGDVSGSGHDHHSTDLSTATLPYSPPHGTNQLPDDRIPGQSPLDSGYNHSTVMVPPPSSESSQCGDHSNSTNSLSEHRIPELHILPSYNLDEDLSLLDHDGNNSSHHFKILTDGEQLGNDDIPDQEAISEERPMLETGARFYKSSLGKLLSPEQTVCSTEDLTSDVGPKESFGDKCSSHALRDSCLIHGQRISDDNNMGQKPEMCLENNPLECQKHGNGLQFVRKDRPSDGILREDLAISDQMSEGNGQEKVARLEEDQECHSSLPCSYDENAGTERKVPMASDRKKSGVHLHEVSPNSSDSEESSTNMVDRLHDVIITPGICDIQETRM